MPTFVECLVSAARQGAITAAEATQLRIKYEQQLAAAQAAGLPTNQVGAHAKAQLIKQLDEDAALKQAQAALTAQKQAKLTGYLKSHTNLSGESDVLGGVLNLWENFGAGAGIDSVVGRIDATIGLAHSQLAELLTSARRSMGLGRRLNKPMSDDVIDEVLGEPTKSPEAKSMAKALAEVIETLRKDFNSQGGNIGYLPNYLPQKHDPRALLNAKYPAWLEFTEKRLDLNKMKDPLTGGPLSETRLKELLPFVYDGIVTGGWSEKTPTMQATGAGMLANRRGEERFLHFKTAADWRAYNKEFGSGDPIVAIFEHINSMARDIGAMEVLGPNPAATTEWLKQVVQSEAAKKLTGQPSLYKHDASLAKLQQKIGFGPHRIQAMHDYVLGRPIVSGNVATAWGDVRNVITAAALGTSSITAFFTDPVNDAAARYLSGLPMTKAMTAVLHTLSSGTADKAVRAGLFLEDFKHITGDQARWAGQLGGGETTKWLADRVLRMNGLAPMTQARKHLFGLEWMAMAADNVAKPFDQLSRYQQRTFSDYGITSADWDAMRAIPVHIPSDGSAGLLRASDIAAVDRDLAKRYLTLIYGQTERAVPTGTARARSVITGITPRGTFWGELAESGLQFKSFALSFMTLQTQAVQMEMSQSYARGAAYAMGLAGALTITGGLSLQIRQWLQGKEFIDMRRGTFWGQAAAQGGGFGIAGDFLLSDQNRLGTSLQSTLMGPTVNLGEKVLDVGVGNIQQLIQGKKTNFAREAVNMAGQYTPGLSSLPYTRLAYRRLFLDQLIYQLDPDAHKYFRDQEQKLKNETGQQFWWRPGQVEPSRAPDPARALGR